MRVILMRWLCLPLILGCVLVWPRLLSASPSSVDRAEEPPGDGSNAEKSRHERGRDIYNYRCYFCHGYSGDGRTLTATFVNPPPRNFQHTDPDELSRSRMIEAVKYGRPDTAMTSFSRLLNDDEIALVVDFVRLEFMQNAALNTRYHTPENGWPDHDRHRIAFPFATGEIALDGAWGELSEEQARGKRLFLAVCVTCHDRARVLTEGVVWRKQSISYPRNNYSHTEIDAISAASIYALHDVSPRIENLTADEQAGKALWLENCAFCHAADGTGQNWIGSFLEPPPRDLTSPDFMRSMNRDLLRRRIEDGLRDTSMPAWKHVLSTQQIDRIISYISRAFHPVADPGSQAVN